MKASSINLELPANPVIGHIISRPTRFILLIELEGREKEIYLPNSGALSSVIEKDREILCLPSYKGGRKTDFDGFAVRVGEFYVTIDSRFANTIFEKVLRGGFLFRNFSILSKEKNLPEYGRIDFIIRSLRGITAYVEVKSCTHVEDGVAKFPDRPTQRGRKHLRTLSKLAKQGNLCWIVFVVQRPDATEFQPFREVDQEFSELLSKSVLYGVEILAFKTEFIPPNTIYFRGELPIVL